MVILKRLFNKNTEPKIVNALENLRPLWATTREIDGIIYEGNLNREKLIYTNRKYKKNKYLKNAQSKSRVV